MSSKDGFYTETPLGNGQDNGIFSTPDQRNLIIGCTLGVVLFISILVGCIFAVKLYYRQDPEEEDDEEAWMIEIKQSLVLNPGSQFSLAIQRASEIPSSPPP
ncbi:hypothetical protein MFLAVUS_001610 [Mucor flavus]|uniref:Uncharacterized protein n=1 Tax=Mucor flavus TaxID=439312 RepID=A0ABP9YMZ5_9FUNG